MKDSKENSSEDILAQAFGQTTEGKVRMIFAMCIIQESAMMEYEDFDAFLKRFCQKNAE